MVTPVGHLALGMLVGEPTLLNLAREVSAAIGAVGEGGVIGGIAVFLHGYPRTTVDINVFTQDPQQLAGILEEAGFTFESDRRQFCKQGVPVHLVRSEELPFVPSHFVMLDGIRVVSLPDLLSMKLASGTRSARRTRDLADVSELIQRLKLDKTMTPRIAPEWRDAYRKLVDAIKHDLPRWNPRLGARRLVLTERHYLAS